MTTVRRSPSFRAGRERFSVAMGIEARRMVKWVVDWPGFEEWVVRRMARSTSERVDVGASESEVDVG